MSTIQLFEDSDWVKLANGRNIVFYKDNPGKHTSKMTLEKLDVLGWEDQYF